MDLDTTQKATLGWWALRIAVTVFLLSSGSFGFGLLLGSSVVVDPGEQAVHTSGGQFVAVEGPGINPGIPFWDQYTVFDMRQNLLTKTGEDGIQAVTSDDINIDAQLKLRWDIADSQGLEEIFKEVAKTQDNLREKVVVPAIEEAPRLCANSRQAEAIITDDREEYKQCITDRVSQTLQREGLVLNSLEIVNMDYPQSLQEKFEESRNLEEERQIAQQQVEIAREESRAEVVRAENQAEAIQNIRGNLTDKYLQYIAIQDGLSNAQTIYVVPAQGGSVPIAGEIPIESNGDGGGSTSPSPTPSNGSDIFDGNGTGR